MLIEFLEVTQLKTKEFSFWFFSGCSQFKRAIYSEETKWKLWGERQGGSRCKRSRWFSWSLQEGDRNVHRIQGGVRDHTAPDFWRICFLCKWFRQVFLFFTFSSSFTLTHPCRSWECSHPADQTVPVFPHLPWQMPPSYQHPAQSPPQDSLRPLPRQNHKGQAGKVKLAKSADD